MREIILDTETTGLDPASGHRIVEIGCLEIVNGNKTGEVFHTYLNPERDMPPEAEAVHGLSNAFLSDKPRFAEVVDRLLEFIGEARLVIHNAAFDMKFINAELGNHGFAPIAMDRAVDTVSMARKKFPGSPASLDALCKRFAIDSSARTKHGALLDAELLSEVYIELLGGRQAALTLDPLAGRGQAETASALREALAPRDFSPTAEEVALHEDMQAKLKNPLWETA